MRFLDLFAGIGGFRLALEQAGHKCIGFCEIDKFARQTYKANFGTEGEWNGMTSQPLQMTMFASSEGLTLSPEDFHAKLSRWLASEEDLTIQEALSFLKLLVSQGFSNPAIYCLKTSKAYSITPGGTLSLPSSIRWQNWAIGGNTRYLTAKISEFPKTENECSLLDILEDSPRREIFPITRTSGQALRQLVGGGRKVTGFMTPVGQVLHLLAKLVAWVEKLGCMQCLSSLLTD